MTEMKFRLLLVLVPFGLWVQSASGDPGLESEASLLRIYAPHKIEIFAEPLHAQPPEVCSLNLDDSLIREYIFGAATEFFELWQKPEPAPNDYPFATSDGRSITDQPVDDVLQCHTQ